MELSMDSNIIHGNPWVNTVFFAQGQRKSFSWILSVQFNVMLQQTQIHIQTTINLQAFIVLLSLFCLQHLNFNGVAKVWSFTLHHAQSLNALHHILSLGVVRFVDFHLVDWSATIFKCIGAFGQQQIHKPLSLKINYIS